jgi:hypothetical protein
MTKKHGEAHFRSSLSPPAVRTVRIVIVLDRLQNKPITHCLSKDHRAFTNETWSDLTYWMTKRDKDMMRFLLQFEQAKKCHEGS